MVKCVQALVIAVAVLVHSCSSSTDRIYYNEAHTMEDEGGEVMSSQAFDDTLLMWPTTIPYELDSTIAPRVRRGIRASIDLFATTCVRFVPRGPANMDEPYIWFRRTNTSSDCYSDAYGMPVNGSRDIFLGRNCEHAIAGHELMHALGRVHEHSRPDRDQYITVFPENFQSFSTFNVSAEFAIYPNADTQGLPYDYDSIMHYTVRTFSISRSRLTIRPKDRSIPLDRLGQQNGFSSLDLAHVNVRYCNKSVSMKPYSGWPEGTYSLPKPNTIPVCPSNTEQGSIFQDNNDGLPSGSGRSIPLHLDGQFLGDTRITYCTFTQKSNNTCGFWPNGSYCIGKHGKSCPSHFQEGSVFWDDEDFLNDNRIDGTVPAGEYGRNTRIFYCCRNDSAVTTPIVLPTEVPFILLRQSRAGCQQVVGMRVTLEWVRTDDEDDNNSNYVTGSAPHVRGFNNNRLSYCYYEKM